MTDDLKRKAGLKVIDGTESVSYATRNIIADESKTFTRKLANQLDFSWSTVAKIFTRYESIRFLFWGF